MDVRVSPFRTGVVLVNFGDADDTLSSLDAIEMSHDLDLHVIVVDNNPHEDPVLAAGIAGRAELLRAGDNVGYAAGNNLAIRRLLGADCEFVWILNPDTIVAPDTLPLLVQHMRDYPDCGIAGPRIVHTGDVPKVLADGGEIDVAAFGATRHLNAGGSPEPSDSDGPRDVDYVPGACALVRRSMIEDVGLVPEQYFLYFEETDWCVRARRAGWRTMVDTQLVIEHHKRSGITLPKPYYLYYMTRNRYHFAVDCLGVDGEQAWRNMEEEFHGPLRAKVERIAPHWIDSFDELVAWAKRDARSGVYGRNDAITHYPDATVQETARAEI